MFPGGESKNTPVTERSVQYMVMKSKRLAGIRSPLDRITEITKGVGWIKRATELNRMEENRRVAQAMNQINLYSNWFV
ncbi:hypothetical protein [Paenibacillus durus]|uniref:hypothetical protein n=1 Tax=Paenibacillus durus TaxID=44251 RepID=UPI0012E0B16A|nr:hypothetical protein [Paenibacillus durus]